MKEVNISKPIRERLKDMIRKELMGDNEDETTLKNRYIQKFEAYKNAKKNRRGNKEIKTAQEELIQAAKAIGIDLPIDNIFYDTNK